jgi:hypothetical protein
LVRYSESGPVYSPVDEDALAAALGAVLAVVSVELPQAAIATVRSARTIRTTQILVTCPAYLMSPPLLDNFMLPPVARYADR